MPAASQQRDGNKRQRLKFHKVFPKISTTEELSLYEPLIYS